jgi:Domain of unknown function (DUF6458)
MTIGASIFLIAVGAILKFAVTASISGIDLATVGVILMIAGIAGLLIGLFLMANARRHPAARDPYADRDPYRDRV